MPRIGVSNQTSYLEVDVDADLDTLATSTIKKMSTNSLKKLARGVVGAEFLIAKAECRKPWSGISICLIVAIIGLQLATLATKAAVTSIPDSAFTVEFVQGVRRGRD